MNNPLNRNAIFLMLLSLFMGSVYRVNAQITLTDIGQAPKLKNAIVFVVFTDTAAMEALPYISAIRSAWTFSRLEFINRVDMTDNIKNGNYFLSIETVEKTSKSLHYSGSGNTEKQYVQHYSLPYLRLWYPTSIKKKKDGVSYSISEIAHLELYMDITKIRLSNPVYPLDMDENSTYLNLNPGFLKNYIQVLNNLLASNKTLKLKTNYYDVSKLQKLKDDTLFVPKFVLKGLKVSSSLDQANNTLTATVTPTKNKSADLFKDYQFTYKMISSKKLSTKIIESENPFYYLMFVNEVYSRYITIVDSQTGEIIYCQYSNLKPRKDKTRSLMNSDILLLQKKINTKIKE